MLEVVVYDGLEINVFVIGVNCNKVLVVVFIGLLYNMSEDEVEVVLGYEIVYVVNGDMIMMVLLQGVLNIFVIVLVCVVGGVIDSVLLVNCEGGGCGFVYYIIVFVLEMVFGLFVMMILMWFLCYCEFCVDVGGVNLVGCQKMIVVLECFKFNYGQSILLIQIVVFGIVGFMVCKLFMSYLLLDECIVVLKVVNSIVV